MSIGFTFLARTRKTEGLKEHARKLAEETGYSLTEGPDGFRFKLCSMGELSVHWGGESGLFGQREVTGECYSTPCGAGFHKAAVELLDELERGPLKLVSVEDETGYYEDRDFERMREEHFYPWLKTLVRMCREKMRPGEYESLCLCWNLEQYQPEKQPGTVITPMGRFDARSMVKAVETLGLRWLADQFFLWDGEEKDACFYRNTAMNLLWEDCCFVPSGQRESDRLCHERIIKNLEQAARMNPLLPLPISTYLEVCALSGHQPLISETAPRMEETFPIGFRRGTVTHSFGSLRIQLPGAWQYEWEESEEGDGNALWWDGDNEHPIWRVSVLIKREGDAELKTPFDKEQDVEDLEMPNGRARWGWYEVKDEEELYYQIFCEAVSGPSLFLITVTYSRQEDREELYRLLRNLKAVKETLSEEHTESYQEE